MEALRQPDNGVTKDQRQAQLPPGCLQEAEYQFTLWQAFIPNGIDAEALQRPEFWGTYAARLKPFDEIRARAEDGTWLARYVVLEAGRTWARLHRTEYHALGTQDVSLTKADAQAKRDAASEFKVYHRGPKGWSVVRQSDKQVMRENETSKEAAESWLTQHLRLTEAPQTA